MSLYTVLDELDLVYIWKWNMWHTRVHNILVIVGDFLTIRQKLNIAYLLALWGFVLESPLIHLACGGRNEVLPKQAVYCRSPQVGWKFYNKKVSECSFSVQNWTQANFTVLWSSLALPHFLHSIRRQVSCAKPYFNWLVAISLHVSLVQKTIKI